MSIQSRVGFGATVACALLLLVSPLSAQIVPTDPSGDITQVFETDEGLVIAIDLTGALVFRTWGEYFASDFFNRHGMRCGFDRLPIFSDSSVYDGSTADCSSTSTNPSSEYSPTTSYKIPVVVHILMHPNGSGAISNALVHSQIDVLNEDFQAIAGSPGAPGTDTAIEFFLATEDPSGNPTTGITRHTKTQWYNDSGNYANKVGWDTHRYLNIYTNSAGGYLGYAYLPSGGGVVGSSYDGVRIYWGAFGKDAPIGHPYNLGRTTTHEVGHYLGLYHTFQGGCASGSNPACHGNGDLICDTNPEQSYMYSGSCSRSTCGSSDPVSNYMDYSDDLCMNEFTNNQTSRMRCTLANFRTSLPHDGDTNTAPTVTITSPPNNLVVNEGESITFVGVADDAEDGSLSSSLTWSSNRDGFLGSGSSITAFLSVGTHTVTGTVTDSGGKSASDGVVVSVQSTSGFNLSVLAYKVKGRVNADLTWTGASGSMVEIWRDGVLIAITANDGFFTENTGLKGSGSLIYQACETSGRACSQSVTAYY